MHLPFSMFIFAYKPIKHTFMKISRILTTALLAIVLAACGEKADKENEKNTPPDRPPVTVKKLAVKGLMHHEHLTADSPTVLSDDDIAELNTATCEIIFNEIEPAETLTSYDSLVFMLSDEYLFTAAATLNPGFIFPGCIYIEQKEGNYRYFYYPDEYVTGWQTFVEHMTSTGRTFFDDSYRPDTSLPPYTPTFPPFEEPDTNSVPHTNPNDVKYYYWYSGEKVPLDESVNEAFVLYRENSPAAAQVQSLAPDRRESDYEINIDSRFTNRKDDYFSNLRYSTVSVSCAELLRQSNNDGLIYSGPCYTKNGVEIPCSNLLYVKLKSESDFPFLEEMAKKLNVIIIYQEKLDPLMYTLFCTNESKFNALQTGNTLYETGRFKYAHASLGTAQLCSVNDTPPFTRQ